MPLVILQEAGRQSLDASPRYRQLMARSLLILDAPAYGEGEGERSTSFAFILLNLTHTTDPDSIRERRAKRYRQNWPQGWDRETRLDV